MNKELNWGLSGDQKRIFVSAAFGCQYNCTYCYLRDIGVVGIQQIFDKEEILKELHRKEIFVPGKEGSLITIGCYTECWDEINRETTIELINHFLKQGNYVQISTKKKIYPKDINAILNNIKFRNQMNIFVSLPTLSYSEYYEPDTDAPNLRIENLDIKQKYGINTYLYIKPVIKSVTIKDKERYAELVKKYEIPVVIGELIYPISEKQGKGFLMGNAFMAEHNCDDSDELAFFLEKYTSVYRHSDDAIKHMKK